MISLVSFLHGQFRPTDDNGGGPGYSAINTLRSAISAVASIEGKPAGQHPLVKIFMRAVFQERPALPRYGALWDPDIVLAYLKNLGPNKGLTILLLAGKLLLLMLLLSGQRMQTLHVLNIQDMVVTSDCVIFQIRSLLKTSRPNHHLAELRFGAYTLDSSLCVVEAMNTYLERTSLDRGSVNSLFLTTRAPFKAASRDTLRNWAKKIMASAGIDMKKFGPGSTRGASSSKAGLRLTSDEIVASVGWSATSTFGRFYKRPLLSASEFAAAVLG